MTRIPALLFLIVFGVTLLVFGAVFAEPITLHIRRYLPDVRFEGEGFLLWGLLLSAAFVVGLVVMYLLLRL